MTQAATALHAAAITLALAAVQFASAEDSPYQISSSANATANSGSAACSDAYAQAEKDALDQIDAFFDSQTDKSDFRVQLISQQEARKVEADGRHYCEFTGVWQAQPVASASALIGSEQYIDGVFEGSCLDESNGDICWQRIVRQARAALYADLEERYGNTDGIVLEYADFEGRQRDQYAQKRLQMTADGRFFFEVLDAEAQTRVTVTRRDSPPAEPDSYEPEPQPVAAIERKTEKKADKDQVDVTLFYAWDGNDSAWADDLAISSNRWGVGVWANNRIGFVAFSGEDRVGIANKYQTVKDARGYYDTLGIGMGYRLWKNRGLTMENMLYYVDAQPYTAMVNPSNCADCTAREFTSRDYMQATVNLKTNSHGINIGWMFTWKFIDQQTNVDRLSSGFYAELQF